MEKVFVVQRVARKLFATEHALDAAVSEAAELLADMVKARKDLHVAATVSEAANAKVLAALAALGDARSAIVEAHNELNSVKLRLGVRTKMAGWEDKPPEEEPKGRIERDLRQVG